MDGQNIILHLSTSPALTFFWLKWLSVKKKIEHSNTEETFGPRERNFYWRAAILFSASALEAYIYDLLTDEYSGVLADLNKEQRNNQINLIERKSTLTKLNFAYLSVTGKKLKTGAEPIQSINNILDLRNEIVHYKSEWRDEAKISISLEKKLRGRFKLNNLKTSDLFFPDKCVSISSAEWVIENIKHFIKWFSSEIDKKCPI